MLKTDEKAEDVRLTLRLPRGLWRQLRHAAADRDQTLQDYITSTLRAAIEPDARKAEE